MSLKLEIYLIVEAYSDDGIETQSLLGSAASPRKCLHATFNENQHAWEESLDILLVSKNHHEIDIHCVSFETFDSSLNDPGQSINGTPPHHNRALMGDFYQSHTSNRDHDTHL